MAEKSVVDQIKHYQRDIVKCPDNAKRMIRCIERLMVLPVTIAHLQETGVGRSVNELRKCGGEVGAAANALVCKWKSMVQAEEDSDAESEVEEEQTDTLQVHSSPDLDDSPPHVNEPPEKHGSVDKYKKNHESEEHRNQKSDHRSRKTESSRSENRTKSSEKKNYDKLDDKSHRSKSSKSEHGSESDSKHSSSHKSKSRDDSRSSKKSHSSHRSDSECNGGIKTDKSSSKVKLEETKSYKSSSSESHNKDIKHKNDKDRHRREDSSQRSEKENRRREEKSMSSNNSKKYDVRKIESESSDDDEVYKPRSKKRKKSESEEDRKSDTRVKIKSDSEDQKQRKDRYSGRTKDRDHKRRQSSEESDEKSGSGEDEGSRPTSRLSESRYDSDNEEVVSNRSSPNNSSDNEVENESRRSSPGDRDSHSERASGSEEGDTSPEREIYVPTKIKREKESPPRQSKTSSTKTSSDKSKSSHSRSSLTSSHNSSNHNSSHSSSSYSKNDKGSSSKKESLENVRIKKEKDENEDSNKRREEKSNDKKSHKSSSSHSSSSKSRNEKQVKVKIEKEDDGSIDCVSGASFADALMGLSEPKKKSVKRKPSTPEKPSKIVAKPSDSKSKSLIKSEPSGSSSSSSSKTGFRELDLLSKNVKLEPLDVDLKSTLPEISPHYKPLPHYSPPVSPPGKRTKMSQEEALSTIMSTKNQRTKVYSGNKSGYLKVPSLFDLCIQVLRDNIEALEYTGGVPYDLLKPVLDRATAPQLFQLEHYNPYLVEDTDSLWKFHCNKDFRGKEPDEFETWRELYVRLLDERERKLEALKANITQSMAKSTPVRQTKLAYVDSVVKPPRNIAKKQMKFGTGKAVKHDLVSKAMVGAASGSPAPPVVPVPAPPASARSSHSSNAFPIPGFLKKKKAPLMQKTLQLIKGNRFKR